MSNTETLQETFRDISYSEVSLDFRDISEYKNKTYQVGISIRDYVDAFFKDKNDESENNDYGPLDFRNHILDNSDIEIYSGENTLGKVRLQTAIRDIVKTQINIQNIAIDDINGISIDNGYLFLHYGKGDSIKIDLTRSTVGELYIHEMTKSEIDDLEKPLLVHEKVALIGGVTATVSFIVGIAQTRTIRKIQLNGESFNTIVEGRFRIGDDADINTLKILDILETQGIELDTNTRSFIDTRKQKNLPLGRIERELRQLSRADFIDTLIQHEIDTSGFQNMSDAEFNEIRHDMGEMFADIRRANTAGISHRDLMKEIFRVPKYAKLFVVGGMLLIGADSFSGAFRDPDDIGAYLGELGIIGAFSVGALSAGPVMNFIQGAEWGKKIPTGPGKIIGGFLLGLGAAVGGSMFAQSVLDIDNRYTAINPEREDWFHKNGFDENNQASRIWNLNPVSGGLLTKAVDGFEYIPKGFERVTGMEAPDIPLIDWEDGADTFLYNSSINASTDPIAYMSETTRTIEQWNTRCDIYKEKAIGEIKALILEHQAEFKNFRDDNGLTVTQFGDTTHREDIFWEEQSVSFGEDLMKILGTPEGQVRYINMRIFDQITKLFAYENNFTGYKDIVTEKSPLEETLTLIRHELGKNNIDAGYKREFGIELQNERDLITLALEGNAVGVELSAVQGLSRRGEFSQRMLSYDDLVFIASLDSEKREFLEKIYTNTLDRKHILELGHYTDQNGNTISQEDLEGGLYRSVYTGAGDIPTGMIRIEYIPSLDESMWDYFTGEIDQDSKQLEFLLTAGINTPETGKESKPSDMFFRFYNRSVEVKKSQVFLDNITHTNYGRAWESDSWIGEVEELTGITPEIVLTSLWDSIPISGIIDYLSNKNK